MDEGQRAAWDKFYGPIIDDFYKKNPQGKELADWKFQRYMRDYMKTVKSLDDNVGRVLDYLKEKNMLDNTLVVYTSDQGFYMGEHGWFDKRFMYEESMHTPLIMRLPKGFDRKGDITELVQNIDYAPTFLELAGAPVPEDIQGVSLLPLLKGEKPADWRKSLYYHFYEYPAEHMVKRHYGVRTERYKLIHFYNDIDVWELYDLQADPTEMHNLYGQKEYEPVVTELKTELARLQEQYNHTIPTHQYHYKNELIYNALYVHHNDVSPYVLPDIHKNDNTMICANQQVFLLSTVEATKHLGYLREQEHLPIPER
jgi:arylsulfatase A-like enzyme